MKTLPLISIAVPSFNQARFIRETLDSLVAQQYPNLEVLIQDGGSTDGAVAVAQEYVARFPAWFQLVVEPDNGFAQALNRAFGRARGEILGYLNTDDTLAPGCLHRVAREIDPARDRHVVFGRCLFTGEDSPYVGVEHPAEYVSHFEQLAVWKRGLNTLPQPSVFWHRRVWEECGGFDEQENHLVDYDLFCRFSRQYRFHKVDELWSTYRMHAASKSAQVTENELLGRTIAASRQYWGAWWEPLRWRCEFSHWRHSQHLHERARHHARRAEQAWESGRWLLAFWEGVQTTRYSPPMTWHRLLQPLLAERGYATLAFLTLSRRRGAESQFTGKHTDNWIGPVYRQTVELVHPETIVTFVLEHVPQAGGCHAKVEVALFVDGHKVASEQRATPGHFQLQATVRRPPASPIVQCELRSHPYFVPRLVLGVPDDRKLCVLLADTVLQPATKGT